MDLIPVLGLCAVLSLHAGTTAITYQGLLTEGGVPATGLYDLRFALYDAPTNGTVTAGPLTNAATTVAGGIFTANLDFGPGTFTGADYWLEIGVRSNGAEAFTTLAPRQPLDPVPTAFYAVTAATATTYAGAVSTTQLTGTVAASNLSSQLSALAAGNGAALSNLNPSAVGSNGNIALLSTNCIYAQWKPNTPYTSTNGGTVMSPDGSLWEVYQSGTSGTVAPSGTAAFTDNTIVWYPYGRAYVSNFPLDIPAISAGPLTNYPSLATGWEYTPYGTGSDGPQDIDGTNYFGFEGGQPVGCTGRFWEQTMVMASPLALGEGQFDTTINGIKGGWTPTAQKISIVTDSPQVGIGPVFQFGFSGWLGNIMVDDKVVSDTSWDGTTSGSGQSFIVLDFHGVRRMRKISWYTEYVFGLEGVYVDTYATVAPAPSNYKIFFEGSSLTAGGGGAPYEAGNLWPSVLGRMLPGANIIIGAVGGTGLIASNNMYIFQEPGDIPVPDNFVGRLPNLVGSKPDMVVIEGCINDGGYPSNTLFIAFTSYLTAVRSNLSTVPIIVFALPGMTSGSQPLASYSAMSNAVFYVSDNNTYYINAVPWFDGTGTVLAPTGAGNSDFYTADGTHPTDFGAEYIAQNFYIALVDLFGQNPLAPLSLKANGLRTKLAGPLTAINIWTNVSATTTQWTNTTGSSGQVTIGGGAVTAIAMNGSTLGYVAGPTPWMAPGAWIEVTYSSAPTMLWWPTTP